MSSSFTVTGWRKATTGGYICVSHLCFTDVADVEVFFV